MSFYDRRRKLKAAQAKGLHNHQWCVKCWQPFADAKANGIYAATALMQAFLDSPMFAELTDKTPEALNRFIENGDTALCCRLGKEVVGRILKESIERGPIT